VGISEREYSNLSNNYKLLSYNEKKM